MHFPIVERCTNTLILIVLGIALPAFGASFECGSSANRTEVTICSDAVLSRLDSVLAADYEKVFGLLRGNELADDQTVSVKALIHDQRRWLKQRNNCRDGACVKNSYLTRIAELRRIGCQLEPESECGPENATILPSTADGRLVILSPDDCQIGPRPGGFQDQSEAIEIQADCIEANIYDPCDDAGGSWGLAQCAWAHLEVAKRRITKAEAMVVKVVNARKLDMQATVRLGQARDRWTKERDRFCDLQNRLYANAPASDDQLEERPLGGESNSGEPFGFCVRRLTEERANDLEKLASALNNKSTTGDALAELRQFLELQPNFGTNPWN